MENFIRHGRICRIDELSPYVRRVAVQFATLCRSSPARPPSRPPWNRRTRRRPTATSRRRSANHLGSACTGTRRRAVIPHLRTVHPGNGVSLCARNGLPG